MQLHSHDANRAMRRQRVPCQRLSGKATIIKEHLDCVNDMSGIEIIGLVLGALPLLISAFEHLRDACEAKDLLLHFKKQHSKCWNGVKDEEIIFRMHLQKLLLPLVQVDVLDNDEIDALILEPGGSNWKERDVEAAFKQRLGEAHDRYFEILEDIPKILHRLFMMLGCKLSSFQARMQALKAAQPAFGTARARMLLGANARLLTMQFHFAVTKISREDLLRDLHENIQRLESFLALSAEVATLHEQNTVVISQRAIKTLLQYGHHASQLYGLIYQRWSCACKQSHCAHLWLQHQVNAPFELRLLVMYAPKGSQAQPLPPWQQQGLQILWCDMKRMSEIGPQPSVKDQTALSPSKTTPPPMTASKVVRSILSRNKRRSGRTSVKFGVTEPRPDAAIMARSDALQMEQASHKRSRRAAKDEAAAEAFQSEIRDLCEVLAGCSMIAGCVGSLTDQELGGSYRVLSQPRQKIAAGEVSLHEVLQPAHRPRISRIKRFQIALKVASSHLKLHSTPWARKQWEAKDIRFPFTGTDPRTIMSDDPYVATDFNDTVSEAEKLPQDNDRSFACLGIMLLELLFGFTLEQHELWQLPSFQNQTDPMLRLMVAARWADDAEGEGGPDFASVIKWCLSESPTTLKDEQWRRDLAERVVLPLEKCCDWIQGKLNS